MPKYKLKIERLKLWLKTNSKNKKTNKQTKKKKKPKGNQLKGCTITYKKGAD